MLWTFIVLAVGFAGGAYVEYRWPWVAKVIDLH